MFYFEMAGPLLHFAACVLLAGLLAEQELQVAGAEQQWRARYESAVSKPAAKGKLIVLTVLYFTALLMYSTVFKSGVCTDKVGCTSSVVADRTALLSLQLLEPLAH